MVFVSVSDEEVNAPSLHTHTQRVLFTYLILKAMAIHVDNPVN